MNLSIREFVYYKLDGLVAKTKMDRVSMAIAEWIGEQYVHPHGRQVANLRETNAALRCQLAELRQALEQQRDITKDFLEHGLWKEEDKASELRFYIQNMLTHQHDAMVAALARCGGGGEEEEG